MAAQFVIVPGGGGSRNPRSDARPERPRHAETRGKKTTSHTWLDFFGKVTLGVLEIPGRPCGNRGILGFMGV
ncbi:MAG: hypothetical protein U1F98_17775 [Verrucomicrobiota bacterium]